MVQARTFCSTVKSDLLSFELSGGKGNEHVEAEMSYCPRLMTYLVFNLMNARELKVTFQITFSTSLFQNIFFFSLSPPPPQNLIHLFL